MELAKSIYILLHIFIIIYAAFYIYDKYKKHDQIKNKNERLEDELSMWKDRADRLYEAYMDARGYKRNDEVLAKKGVRDLIIKKMESDGVEDVFTAALLVCADLNAEDNEVQWDVRIDENTPDGIPDIDFIRKAEEDEED